MAEWWSIEVFSGDKAPASQWRYAYEDALTEAAVTHGAMYWDWYDSQYGVVFEVCFATEEEWAAFRELPAVRGALDAVPDPVSGLLIYRGRGGAAGSRNPRKPKPPPSVAPASPTVASPPVGTAKPSSPSVVTTSPWVNPAPTVTVRDAGSSRADFISLTSMTIPPDTFDQPSRLWRPLRARSATSFWRAQVIALTTSSVVVAKTITKG